MRGIELSPELLADPGILPRHRDVLIVPAEQQVDAIAIADLHRLMFAQPVSGRDAHAGARSAGLKAQRLIPQLTSFAPLYWPVGAIT